MQMISTPTGGSQSFQQHQRGTTGTPLTTVLALTQIQVWNQWHLVQQAVGGSCSNHPRGVGLVRDVS